MKFILKIVITLLIFVVLLSFILTENTQCNLEKLTIGDEMMPTNWQKFGSISQPSLPDLGAQDVSGVIYDNGKAITHHNVYRYRNRILASLSMILNSQVFFPNSSNSWIWSDLAGSDDWGMYSNSGRIQCGISNDPLLGSICVASVRYGRYISVFTSTIEEDALSQEEFKSIVLGIDNNFESCLK